ncbi:MAG: methylmalonyl-CoA mutase [Gemmatimonadetes bacterium]|nr:methylmalonyl-CoA mutase [Gemmatimonadota bacterium]
MGLFGMIDEVLRGCDFDPLGGSEGDSNGRAWVDFGEILGGLGEARGLARAITCAERFADGEGDRAAEWREVLGGSEPRGRQVVVGITGTGGAGKSTVTDELIRRFLGDFQERRVAVLAVDPTRRRTGGALLGDRIRVNSVAALAPEGSGRTYFRSMATRASNRATSRALRDAIRLARLADYDLILVETAGIGQSNSEIVEHVDLTVYVMTSEYGAATQLEKIDMLDLADLVVLNKYEKRGGEDALRDVRKQIERNRAPGDGAALAPVCPTIASQFNDPGTARLYAELIAVINERTGVDWKSGVVAEEGDPRQAELIPAERERYLADVADALETHGGWVREQAERVRRVDRLEHALEEIGEGAEGADSIREKLEEIRGGVDPRASAVLDEWEGIAGQYGEDELIAKVGERELRTPLRRESLSGLPIPRVALPTFSDPGDRLEWLMMENLPGRFPFTAGVFPFKREDENPTRMFAGEGPPERTNRRFHYLSEGQPAARLSTAFDSVTLYGRDPEERPDVFGKVGNSGVSICTLDDAKKLYCGFDLCAPSTSVSMTINGPAPTMLAFFLNAAVDQQLERYLVEAGRLDEVRGAIAAQWQAKGMETPRYSGLDSPRGERALGLALLGSSGDRWVEADVYDRIADDTLTKVRGTVQADILKEDQAQNTCIFSIDFALRLMGDIQEELIRRRSRYYYSVSISGYHIAEAGANPITQLAFTLANGFTYVEYYLSRGMKIDDFAPSLSFFFSNGLDPEYAVIGRVARRIWSVAMRDRYGASERSQKLKYHIQTSGRSLHAQEIDYNDIRTTLQALYAYYDNCNSLHTNAFDEAITTPTEDSVRRALAIQLISQKELGMAKNENPLQGAFIVDELTRMVEDAVLEEFRRISRRGGVLGAMETQYQRGKIQEESLHYETLKSSGELPIVGVNTFLRDGAGAEETPELARSTEEEKRAQLENLRAYQAKNGDEAPGALSRLAKVASSGENIFRELLRTARVASLGQISNALFEVGGQYRRSM